MTNRTYYHETPAKSYGKQVCMRLADGSVWEGESWNGWSGIDPLCDIWFTFSHYMKKHMKLHVVENSYQCALCGKWVISWNNKQLHMKSHAGDNPYICALCNQELISRNFLQRYIKGHALDIPYQCVLCFTEFIFIKKPKRHNNRNNGKFHITD